MGWKGTVRSISAAYRAADRESKRRHRDLQKHEKAYAKMQMLEQAAYDVDVYEAHIERLLSIHKDSIPKINWVELQHSPEPIKPSQSTTFEDAARKLESEYKPGFFDRLFGLEKKRRNQITLEVKVAIEKDVSVNGQADLEWMNAHTEWTSDVELAKGVLTNDYKAKLDAIKQIDPFTEITELGSELKFQVDESGQILCELMAHGTSVIPEDIKSLLSSGKLSVKKMPITKFNELYQDYVCSCVLRISNELFSILPEETVIITVIDSLLNSSTGHLDKQPILSVLVQRKTLSMLNMETIDPSDSMRNFLHKMSFNKKTGFSPVDRVSFATA
jgi:hypothetical protein